MYGGEGDSVGVERAPVKISVQSDYEAQVRKATCEHVWKDRLAVLLDYIEVDYQCAKCKTWRRIKPGK